MEKENHIHQIIEERESLLMEKENLTENVQRESHLMEKENLTESVRKESRLTEKENHIHRIIEEREEILIRVKESHLMERENPTANVRKESRLMAKKNLTVRRKLTVISPKVDTKRKKKILERQRQILGEIIFSKHIAQ